MSAGGSVLTAGASPGWAAGAAEEEDEENECSALSLLSGRGGGRLAVERSSASSSTLPERTSLMNFLSAMHSPSPLPKSRSARLVASVTASFLAFSMAAALLGLIASP